MNEPEIVWRGVRWWVSSPKCGQHVGWNNWFIPYTVIKKTPKRVTLRGNLAEFKAFGDATGYSVDKADIEISRAKFEKDAKVYHSRVHEWFYKEKPAVDPDAPGNDPFWRIGASLGYDGLGELGLSRNATRRQIKQTYKRLARKAHPDGGGSHEAFLKLQKAYEAALSAARS